MCRRFVTRHRAQTASSGQRPRSEKQGAFYLCLHLGSKAGSMRPLPRVPASGLRAPSPPSARVWALGSVCSLPCLLWDHIAQKPGHTSSLKHLHGESQAGLLLGYVLIPTAKQCILSKEQLL